MPRFWVPGPLSPHDTVVLDPEQAHRLREVLRLRVGDAVILFDGRGGEYPAVLRTLSRDRVSLETAARCEVMRESPLEITLAQGISRGDRMDYTLQKAVELGVSRIVPLASARSQVRLDAARAARRLQHWRGVVTHACEQSGRDRLPVVAEVTSLQEFMAEDRAALKLTLAPTAAESLVSLAPGATTLSLVIGPEGGLAPEEIALLSGAGYRAVRLGPRILRTETAALVAIASLQVVAGDLGSGTQQR